MLESALLCVVASLNNLLLKKSSTWVEEIRNKQGMMVTGYLLNIFVSKLRNAGGTVIKVMIETWIKIFD